MRGCHGNGTDKPHIATNGERDDTGEKEMRRDEKEGDRKKKEGSPLECYQLSD